MKVDLFQSQESILRAEQNVSLNNPSCSSPVAVEPLISGITLRFYNGAEEKLIQSTLQYFGGMNHA